MKKTRGVRYLPNNSVYDEMDSPVGKLTIVASSEGLHAVLWEVDRKNIAYEKIMSVITKSNKVTVEKSCLFLHYAWAFSW